MSFNQHSSHDHPGVAADSFLAHRSLQHMSRRQIMRLGITLAGTVGIASNCLLGGASADAAALHTDMTEGNTPSLCPPGDSLNRAYHFLDIMMDLYACGSTLRLSQ